MVDVKLDSLPQQSAPREIRKFVGQKSAIRRINLDEEDISQYRKVDDSLGDDFITNKSSLDGLIEEIKNSQPGTTGDETEFYLFAVAGSDGVAKKERGALQGFVSFYPEGLTDQLVKEGKITDPGDKPVYEVSFGKRPGAAAGQMASALRQTCTQLSQINAHFDALDPSKVKPDTVVTAWVREENIESQRVLDATGFKDKGKSNVEDDDAVDGEGPDEWKVYVLDWEELNRKMHEQADAELIGRS